MVLVARGDESAFRRLFDRYRDKVYSFALFLTRNEPMAEEITQDVFTKTWMKREELGQIDYFTSWLKIVARNQAFNYLAKTARERIALREFIGQQSDTDPSTERTLEAREYARLLQVAVDRLPRQQQRVWLLSRREGLKVGQIAAEMQLSPNTVKNHMKEAMRSIRAYFETHIETTVLIAIALFFRD